MTLILLIEYDGTKYSGWQIQHNSNSVQSEISHALELLYGSRINLIGAGRTDAGVHARGQVAHTELSNNFPVPVNKIPKALNSHLPHDIRIKNAIITESDFHARYTAIAREYSYTLTNIESVFNRHFTYNMKYPFNPEILNQAAPIFLGEHDFTTFSKINYSTKSYICNVETCYWETVNPNTWRLHIKANRFVYGMVRALTGAMLDASRSKRSIEELKAALETKDRSLSSPLAPPKGLILERIYYPPELKIFE